MSKYSENKSVLLALITLTIVLPAILLTLYSTQRDIVSASGSSMTTTVKITKCTVITSPGVYILTQNISGTYPGEDWCIKINASNVIFDGQGNSIESVRGIGVLIESADNVTIKNTKITRSNTGIRLLNSSRSVVINNIIASNGDGVWILNSENNIIANNTIISNKWSGIRIVLYSWSDTRPMLYSRNNIVANNTIAGNGGHGIQLVESENNIVANNTIVNNYDGVLIDHSSGNMIVGNAIANTTNYEGSGIRLAYSENNTIANNTIASNEGSGIRLDLSSNNTITSNVITNNKGLGVWLVDSVNNIVANNSITNNSAGIRLANSSSSAIASNIITNNKVGIELYLSSSNLIYNNLFNNTLNTQVYDEDSISYWNTTLSLGRNIIGGNWIGGNYWATPSGTGHSQICRDVREPIGICDEPYKINKRNIDYLPLTSSRETVPQKPTETMSITTATSLLNTTPEITQQTSSKTTSIEWAAIAIIGVGIAVFLSVSLYFLARRR